MSTGVLMLTGSDTVADYQAALKSITYSFSTPNGDPTLGGAPPTRTIDRVVNDGALNSPTATSTLDVVHVAPVIAAGGTATFQGGGDPVTLDGSLAVTDVDSNGDLSSASVSISAGFTSGDTLSAITTNTGITASYDAMNGILSLTGMDTLANYQTVLDSVAYSFSPTNSDPTGGGGDTTRTIKWVANDSVLNSTEADSHIDVMHVAPTVTPSAQRRPSPAMAAQSRSTTH